MQPPTHPISIPAMTPPLSDIFPLFSVTDSLSVRYTDSLCTNSVADTVLLDDADTEIDGDCVSGTDTDTDAEADADADGDEDGDAEADADGDADWFEDGEGEGDGAGEGVGGADADGDGDADTDELAVAVGVLRRYVIACCPSSLYG